MPELVLIAARARNGVIGADNKLCWSLPEDLARFRRLTLGFSVIMGRKTWESLPAAVRPLAGRQNIVVSRQSDYVVPGAQLVSSLELALRLVTTEKAFIIGGAQLYAAALPLVDVLELTEVELAPPGDAFFPELDERDWRLDASTPAQSATGLRFVFVRYVRALR